MEYSIDLLHYLLTYSEDELKQIKQFLSELNSIRNQDKRFDRLKFMNSIEKIISKKKRFDRNLYYSSFIKTNSKLIEDMLFTYFGDKNNNLFNNIVKISGDKKSSFGLCHLIDHIIANYDNKSVMVHNIYKLSDLHIDTFKYLYKPNAFDIEEKCGVRVMECGNKGKDDYILSSFYTDGKKKWFRTEGIVEYEIDEHRFLKDIKSCYNVFLENVSYILYYTKSKSSLSNIVICLNRLDFDTSTLPRYDEIYDNEVWQELGDSTTKAIDNVSMLVDSSMEISKMMDDISKLDILSSQDYYKDTLKQMKELCKRLNNLSTITANAYLKDEEIVADDLKKALKI